jgi:hypothetical protein
MKTRAKKSDLSNWRYTDLDKGQERKFVLRPEAGAGLVPVYGASNVGAGSRIRSRWTLRPQKSTTGTGCSIANSAAALIPGVRWRFPELRELRRLVEELYRKIHLPLREAEALPEDAQLTDGYNCTGPGARPRGYVGSIRMTSTWPRIWALAQMA